MSPRAWRERIEDILGCIHNIQAFVKDMNQVDFVQDLKTIRAVAFELSTIGEAVRAIPIEIRQRYQDIPWNKMQSIRNVIVHEYFRIDEEILWQTIQEDLPPLVPMLEPLIQKTK